MPTPTPPIDRRSLVTRHNPTLTSFDPLSPLTVGNGSLAFTPDLTGLQTFPDPYRHGTPLCTLSHWSWHSTPRPSDLPPLRYTLFDTHGRPVPYPSDKTGQEPTFNYLRENPHRFHIGRLAFLLHTRDGRLATPADLADTRQTLDLWTGTLRSHFSLNSSPGDVLTSCHPTRDALSVNITGPLLEQNWLTIQLSFPAPSPDITAADWAHPDHHSTTLTHSTRTTATLLRQLDQTTYTVTLHFPDTATLKQTSPHDFELTPHPNSTRLWLTCEFLPANSDTGFLSTLSTTRAAGVSPELSGIRHVSGTGRVP